MWINVRSVIGKQTARLDGLSKLTKIEDIRLMLVEEFRVSVNCQRLFYRGKQLEDGYSLFDYDVGLNDTILLMIKEPVFYLDHNCKGNCKSSSAGSYTCKGKCKGSSAGSHTCKGKCKAGSDSKISSVECDSRASSSAASSSRASSGESDGSKCETGKLTVVKRDSSNSQSKELLPVQEEGTKLKYFTQVECIVAVPDRVADASALMRSTYFKVGDLIDALDVGTGAWFEAVVQEIQHVDACRVFNYIQDTMDKGENTRPLFVHENDECQHIILYDSYEDEGAEILPRQRIRPRAHQIIKFSDLTVGSLVYANYNPDEPDKRGFYYDCIITEKRDGSVSQRKLVVTLLIGIDRTPLKGCHIKFIDEIYRIEPLVSYIERTYISSEDQEDPYCKYCKNKPDRLCKHCSCCKCGGKDYPDKQLICDECEEFYHTYCLFPPLLHIPNDEWYCPDCKNDKTEIVQAGEKLKESKKRAKMASSSSKSKRNWGRGMACIGRTKICTIVPPHHFGPIPGIEVGMMWKFRVQVSEVGVHRPHVAGIHGRDSSGAFSLVLSGGYEDDLDEGERFTYTGSGGRDLSGNKRTAEQSCDQTLTRMNRALALNCDAPINRNGATSKNWKAGKPVRVVRNFNGCKHSKYCPQQGNRYDGIYKVVKYWPETGKSGFLVWRYLLRRDDPTPAPWTPLGKHRIQRLGFVMQYPDGYEDPVEGTSRGTKRKLPSSSKETSKVTKRKAQSSCKGTSKATKKELLSSSDSENDSIAIKQELGVAEEFRLPSDVESLIMKDTKNQKLWEECKKCLSTKVSFLKEVEKCFQCICCQDLVANPITTTCKHNICKHCLERSFKAEVFCCPMCRHMLGKNYVFTINNMLKSTLKTLFFGYDAGR